MDDAFFQPEAFFRPLRHVVAVLADDIRDVNNAQVHHEVLDYFANASRCRTNVGLNDCLLLHI